MKPNLNLISKRAQSFIETPTFYKAGLPADFEVTLDAHDKILTVFHGKNKSDVDFIIAEVMAKFSGNKNFLDVWKINFREIESFLRDENHLPAFPENNSEAEIIFNQMKISLIGFAVKAKLGTGLKELLSQRKSWNQQTLAAKNLWAQTILSALGWQLILCEGDVLTVKNAPSELDEEGLSLVISTILSGHESLLPMKVVAV